MSYSFWFKFALKKTSLSSKVRNSVLETTQNLDQEFLFVVEFFYTFIFGIIFIIDSYVLFPKIWSCLSIAGNVLSIIVRIFDVVLCYILGRLVSSAFMAFILKVKYSKRFHK